MPSQTLVVLYGATAFLLCWGDLVLIEEGCAQDPLLGVSLLQSSWLWDPWQRCVGGCRSALVQQRLRPARAPSVEPSEPTFAVTVPIPLALVEATSLLLCCCCGDVDRD